MGDHDPTRVSAISKTIAKCYRTDFKSIAETRLTDPNKCPQARRYPSKKVQLYTFDNFMSSQECDAISDLICQSLRPSTIITASPESDKYFRTSSTCDLGTLESDLIDALDQKISRTVGIRLSYSEAAQGQFYAMGQEFKPHTDYFEPGDEIYAKQCAVKGNRTWTFMVYLSDVAKGGGTHFIALDHVFQPKKGHALIWNNLDANGSPNHNTLHAGLRVEEGHKIIVTKWFREQGRGPMFYSD